MSSKPPVFAFRPQNTGLEKFWGKLEARILEIIWADGPMTVKRALYHLNKNQDYAYTTVMTVMNRLARKGILDRELKGKSFVYAPAMSKDEFLELAVMDILGGLARDYEKLTFKTISQLKKHRRGKTG